MPDVRVTVVYASLDQQFCYTVSLSAHANVAMAIRQSGVLQQCSELQLESLVLGIFAKKVSLDASLRDGDRIEIYRPLTIDPMTARRLRAKKRT